MNYDNKPLITVALPVLNGGDYLKVSVQSILNQSLTNWELLIIDDGSTDGAIDRLNCLSDSRVIVVRDGRNLGLAARLNQAVTMSKGKYFARMDHDDISHPERFARQIAFLESHSEVDLLAACCVTIDDRNRLIGVLPSALDHLDICRRPWQGFYMPHPSWIGRTEWFRLNCYQDPSPYCCEDQELLLRTHYSSCFHTLPDYLLAYRVRTMPPLHKQFRTRVAMGKMKARHFLLRLKLAYALLSIFTEFARIIFDLLQNVRCRIWQSGKNIRSFELSAERSQEWETIIYNLKYSSGRKIFNNLININN